MSRVIEIIDSDDDIAGKTEHVQKEDTLASALKPRSRHKRKSVHQPKRASPEIQFLRGSPETILLDCEAGKKRENLDKVNQQLPQIKTIPKLKQYKTTPTILISKPVVEKCKKASTEIFSEDLQIIIRQIAEERVRINYLLNACGMPKLKFSLYSRLSDFNASSNLH